MSAGIGDQAESGTRRTSHEPVHTRTEMSDTADPTARIERLRAQMESVDCELVSLIARRCELARALGDAKSAIMLPVADLAREAAVLRRVTGSRARPLSTKKPCATSSGV